MLHMLKFWGNTMKENFNLLISDYNKSSVTVSLYVQLVIWCRDYRLWPYANMEKNTKLRRSLYILLPFTLTSNLSTCVLSLPKYQRNDVHLWVFYYISMPCGVFLVVNSETRITSGNKKNNTQDSNVVPHLSTNWARRCLTSLSRREAVLSSWYGRSCQHRKISDT